MNALEKRNSKLLKLEGAYKNAYKGSLFLLILSLIAFALIFVSPEQMQNKDTLYPLLINVTIWAFAFTYARGKLDHIETIKRYYNDSNKNN